MTNPPLFVLTPEQQDAVRQMQAEKVRLEKIVAEAQRTLASLNDRLAAAAVLAGPTPSNLALSVATGPLFGPTPSVAATDGDNLTEAVERLANSSPIPLAKKAVKAVLRDEGFGDDRLANYFYTAISRLKGRGRITVLPDGKIWKAPEMNQGT